MKKHAVPTVVLGFVAMTLMSAYSQIKTPPVEVIANFAGLDFSCNTSGAPTGCDTKSTTYQVATAARTYSVRSELPFDAATTESVYARMPLPHGYQGGKVRICPAWFSLAATTGNVRWGVDSAMVAQSGLMDPVPTTRTFTVATNPTAQKVTRQCAEYTDWPAGPGVAQVKLYRVGGSTLDTLAGDALLTDLTIESSD